MTISTRIENLNKAIALGGGILAFSESLGVSHQVVYQWKKQDYVPTERALLIEHLYGVPYRDMIKPDIAGRLAQPSPVDLV